MASKEKETSILRLVYPVTLWDVVSSSEQPDFIILNRTTDKMFGVEITQFFYHEASARLKNLDGYLDRLVAGSRPIKPDRRLLRVEEFKVYSPDKKYRGTMTGVIYENPLFPDRLNILELDIRKKNDKYSKYDKSLSHTNLIIYDAENMFADTEDLHHQIFSHPIHNAVLSSPFREIFLITSLHNKKYFFSLKAHLLVEKFQLYNSFLRRKGIYLHRQSFKCLTYFTYWMEKHYSIKILIHKKPPSYYLVFANSYIHIMSTNCDGFETADTNDIHFDIEQYQTCINDGEFGELIHLDEELYDFNVKHHTKNKYYRPCYSENNFSMK